MSRTLTSIQFADGTTIDALDRIDSAMEDVLQRWNKVRPSDFKRRWLQSQFVGGYMGGKGAITKLQDALPWMSIHNSDNTGVGDLLTGATAPVGYPENAWRLKGTFANRSLRPDLDSPATLGDQYAWTISQAFLDPVVISGLCVGLHTEATYWDNDWVWGGAAPSGKSAGLYVDDFIIDVSIDSPYTPENRSMADILVKKMRFTAEAEFIYEQGLTPGAGAGIATVDMAPNEVATLAGLLIDLPNINVPIPRDSRVRLSLVIPCYANAASAGWNDAGHAPWLSQYYSWTMTVLEPLEP